LLCFGCCCVQNRTPQITHNLPCCSIKHTLYLLFFLFVINIDKDEASVRSDRSFDQRSGYTDENAQDPNHFDPVSDSEETNCDGSQSSERSSHSSSHSKTHRRSPERRRSSSSSVLTERAIQNRENRRHQHHQETMAPGNSRRQQKTARRKSSRINAATNSDDDDDTQTGRAIVTQMKRERELKEKEHKELLAKLRAEIAELQGKRAKKSKGNRAIPVNKDLKAGFYEVAKAELWRTTKFIADDEELMDATCLVAKKIPELKKHFATEDKYEQEEYARAFSDNCGSIVAKAINDNRSNAQGGLKKAYEKRVFDGKSIPTAKAMLDLALRKGLEFDEKDPQKNADRRELFQWYWEEVVVKVCGSKRWPYSIRNFGCPSTYTPPDSDLKYVTSSDEALIVVLFENCAQRFPYCAQCKTDGEEVDKKDPQYQSKYSDDSCGQDKFGGWNLAGRKRYNLIRKAISKNRKKRATEIKAIERRTLKDIRKKHKLDQSKSLKRKGREPKDFEGQEDAKVACVGLESGDERDEDDDASLELEEFDMNFPARKKKKKKAAQDSDDDDEDGDEDAEENGDDAEENGDDAEENGGNAEENGDEGGDDSGK
jgi:hypothetical protein